MPRVLSVIAASGPTRRPPPWLANDAVILVVQAPAALEWTAGTDTANDYAPYEWIARKIPTWSKGRSLPVGCITLARRCIAGPPARGRSMRLGLWMP